jgi:hypothetical protein
MQHIQVIRVLANSLLLFSSRHHRQQPIQPPHKTDRIDGIQVRGLTPIIPPDA